MAFTSFVSNHAFSQGKIHLGALRIYPLFSERIEFDDNVFQVSGTGIVNGLPVKEKESDLINIYTPALKLELPLRGGGFIPGKEHDLSLDWHSDFKNYRDHASENQQNHHFTASGILKFNRGFEINLDNVYTDTESPAGSETDNIHPIKTNQGRIKINMPDYFRKFDAEISYTNYQFEYDERALRRANRFEHNFTLKIPYKLTPKISLFPEYAYGFIEYDSQSVADAQSDSHYNEIYAGAEWNITGKTTGILKLGFTEMRFDDTERSDIKTFIAELGVRVYLTKRMELDVNAGRGVKQSEFTADSNAFERSFGDFKISRKVWKDLGASFNASYEKQVYHGSERKDDIYGFGLSTGYRIKKWISAGFEYSYRDRHSNFELQSDRINKASVGISFIF